MKSISKTFGAIILFLGIIESMFIANNFGKVMNYYDLELERDWSVTIILFLSCALPSIVLSIILYALSEILERIEIICKALKISIEPDDVKTTAPAEPELKTFQISTPNTTENKDKSTSTWKCPTCGHVNNNSQYTCSFCKLTRPSSTL